MSAFFARVIYKDIRAPKAPWNTLKFPILQQGSCLQGFNLTLRRCFNDGISALVLGCHRYILARLKRSKYPKYPEYSTKAVVLRFQLALNAGYYAVLNALWR
jgi:hypothetical protein